MRKYVTRFLCIPRVYFPFSCADWEAWKVFVLSAGCGVTSLGVLELLVMAARLWKTNIIWLKKDAEERDQRRCMRQQKDYGICSLDWKQQGKIRVNLFLTSVEWDTFCSKIVDASASESNADCLSSFEGIFDHHRRSLWEWFWEYMWGKRFKVYCAGNMEICYIICFILFFL